MNPISTTFILVIYSITVFCSFSAASRLFTDQAMRLNSNSLPDGENLPSDVIEKLKDVQNRSVEWLQSRKTEEFGWPSGETARVVVALASAIEDWPAKHDLVARLIVKQLEIELLEKLLRKDIDPVTPAKVAYFSLALNAACKDPHNFFGHNLAASLEKHHEDHDFPGFPETFGFSLTSLVTCLAGSHLHKRQTRHLVQIARNESTKPYTIDTRGMALLALECIRHRKKNDDRTLTRHMHGPLETIGEEQREDGSFGNIHTTAIAIQALAASDDFEIKWNKTAAALALVAMQEPNGSFRNNIYATAESVVAASALLNGMGILGLRRGHCNSIRHRYKYREATSTVKSSTVVTDDSESHQQQIINNIERSLQPVGGSSNRTTGNSIDNDSNKGPYTMSTTTTTTTTTSSTTGQTTRSEFANVRYWLWIGPDPLTAERYNLTVHAPANTTFFYVMQRAAELATEFEFSSTVWPNGHYIHTISGHREQPIGYHYWLLYLLKVDPDPVSPPSTAFVAPAGVDDLRVQDGQVYLFWFKKI